MSSPSSSVPAPSSSAAAPSASDPMTAGASASSNVTSASTISTLSDLKNMGSDGLQVYNAMMQGIAMMIISDSQHREDRRHAMAQQAQQDAESS